MRGSSSGNAGRGLVSLLAALVLMSGTAANAAGPESATPQTWSVTGNVHTGTLFGVSCRTKNHCVGVGQSNGIHALIETWDGRKWTRTPHPLHGTTNAFASVSCAAANRCMAVGSQYVQNKLRPLAEIWNGKRWTFTFSPIPISHLLGVSCPTADTCVAVGNYTEANVAAHAAAQLWTRDHWSTISPPRLPPNWNAVLHGVSCVSKVYCVAVGTVTPPSGATQALIETWNGTHWSIAPGPPAGALGRELRSVSCRSTTNCVAVGTSGSRTGANTTLITTWDGDRWSITPSENYQIRDYTNELNAVTCASATSCVAVGSAASVRASGALSQPIIASWNGIRWSLAAQYTGTHAYSALLGASCIATFCATTGFSYRPDPFAAQTVALIGWVSNRFVSVGWTPKENRRLRQIAAYLHQSPAQAQKTAVYATAYLIGSRPHAPTPLALPQMGGAATYKNEWEPTELAIIDAVRVRFRLSSVGATRASVYLFSYLLALRGD